MCISLQWIAFNFQINPFNLNDEEIQLGFLMKDESLAVNGNS